MAVRDWVIKIPEYCHKNDIHKMKHNLSVSPNKVLKRKLLQARTENP